MGLAVHTGNPIRDAELYQQNLQEAKNKRGYILCDICHGEILRADEENYGDDVYELDGLCICEYCIHQYVKEHKKELK